MLHSIAPQVRYLAVVKNASGFSTEYTLDAERSLFVGSSPDCGIHLEEENISDKHFLLSLDDGVISIQDWASNSGTYVNGSRIETRLVITENDQVAFGNATLQVRLIGVPTDAPEQSADVNDDDDPDQIDPDQDASCQALHDATQLIRDASDIQLELDTDLDPDRSADSESPWAADFDDESSASPWGPATDGDRQYDQETVDLLKAEIDDLRAVLAERDSQIEELSLPGVDRSGETTNTDQQSAALQQRIDHLLTEAAEQDERFTIVHDLLEAAELTNQAEADERQAFEAWVGEIEHRIGQRESEWQAQLAAARGRLQAAEKQRDQLQHQLREVASRFGAQDVYRETLDKLQTQNSQLQDDLEVARTQHARVQQQLDNLQNREAEDIQQERALIAKERAAVSRLRFELSRKLSEFEQTAEPKTPVDQELALRVQALRSHLREIHQQEQQAREQKGESLFTRLSGLWKRVDDEY